MDLAPSQLLSLFRIHMPVKFPAVTLYIPSYLLLVFDLPHFISKCIFSYSFVVCCSTLVFSCAPGDFLFTQVRGSTIISSLPVQQCDLLSSFQQAGNFCLVVWLVLGIFVRLVLFVCFLIHARFSPLKQIHKGFKIHGVCDCHGHLDAVVRKNDQKPRQVWSTTKLNLKECH